MLYSQGEKSTDAFSKVFDESVNEMGPRVYKQYTKRFIWVILNFLPGSQDQNFVRTKAAPDIETEILDDLKSIEWVQTD